MVLIKLTSTNPQLSFVIKKNPSTGMICREVRKGVAFGYYAKDDPQTYVCYFKDSDTEVSFKKSKRDGFEYINETRYSSPVAVLSLLSEFLSTTAKDQAPEDVENTFEHSFYIVQTYSKAANFPKFEKMFPGFTFETRQTVDSHHQVTIRTRHSLHKLINFVNLFALVNSLQCPEDFDVESSIERHSRTLQNLDAPYCVRNMLKMRLRKESFQQHGEKLGAANMSLTWGPLNKQRAIHVRNVLSGKYDVLDIGCGEGYVFMECYSKLPVGGMWYGIDPDGKERKKFADVAENKELIHLVSLFESFDDFCGGNYDGRTLDVVCNEVIEHMSLDDATLLLRGVLAKVRFATLLITTPNRDFNQYYLLGPEEARHADHKFEFSDQEFREWITALADPEKYTVGIGAVGDRVGESQPTQYAVVRPR